LILNTSKIKADLLQDYKLDMLPLWIGNADAVEMFESVFVESHAKLFSKLIAKMSSKGGGVKLEGFDLLRDNGRSSIMLFQPVIDISSPRKMKLALSSCSFFSDNASKSGTILRLRYSHDAFAISDPIETEGDDLYFLYHDFSEERLKQVLPVCHRAFKGQDKDCFERLIKLRNKNMTREEISEEADNLVAERTLKNTIELRRLQIMSDFHSQIRLWIKDKRGGFNDKDEWLRRGFIEMSQVISELVLEDERESVDYNNFFQKMYCFMRYSLILNWDLTAKDRFSALQSSRGRIGGKISKGGGRPPKKTDERLAEVRKLKGSGFSNRKIAVELGVSPTTIGKWLEIK
jgi:hypothetical protein